MPEGLASPRQANISCQYFQTQKYCQKMRWLISSLQEQCLRSVVYFLVLLLGFASGWKSESLFRAGVITTGCSLALGGLSQTAALAFGALQTPVVLQLWVHLSLGTASKSRKVPRKAAVLFACWYRGSFTPSGVRLRRVYRGETGRWWLGTSRSTSAKGLQTLRKPRTPVKTHRNDAGFALS